MSKKTPEVAGGKKRKQEAAEVILSLQFDNMCLRNIFTIGSTSPGGTQPREGVH